MINFAKGVRIRGFFEMLHLPSVSEVCLTRFQINLGVKFSGAHLLGKACSC